MDLAKTLKTFSAVSKPQIFDLTKQADKQKLLQLFRKHKINTVIDGYREQLIELFAINHPRLYNTKIFDAEAKQYCAEQAKKLPLQQQGVWVYFPWSSTLVHILADKNFQKVRAARNRNLITEQEQDKFYNSTVGIAGLSVGNSVALAIILQGGARHIKLADHDKLELSNTNRIRGSISHLGLSKVEMTARQIYEIDPYAKIEIFKDGLTPKNIDRFFFGVDVIIDEIDNLAVKHLIRQKAKKYRTPVVMAADNGDNGVVDIERYDQSPNTKFFHGRMGNVGYQQLLQLDKFDTGRLIVKHLGPENITARTYESFLEMGKSLASWPQLGGAALLNGSAVAYVVRKILNGQNIQHNRSIISLDQLLVPGFSSPRQKAKRLKFVNKFKKILKIN